jgi:hypothetical protein
MQLLNPLSLAELTQLRDQTAVSSRNTSTGALLYEAFALFNSLNEINPESIKEAIISENRLHKNSYEMRRKTWLAINHRYLSVAPQWVGGSLIRAAAAGSQSPEFVSLAYLYFALRNRLVFLFVTRFLWAQWQAGITHLTHRDTMRFIYELAQEEPQMRAWHEATKKKMASTLSSSLRDFGVLRGAKTRHIQRPSIALTTAYHLLCILHAEGKSGLEIIQDPAWRLFLWREADVSQALAQLDQLGAVRFEKSGQTIILQLIKRGEEQHDP